MSVSMVEQGINAVIRPPRKEYDPLTIPLFLEADGKTFIRHPINFRNKRHNKITGSLYVVDGVDAMSQIPCVIYLHGNASSQFEGQFLIPNLCPRGLAVYCFDFAGCGASTGDYISLGYYEKGDVEDVLNNLTNSFHFTKFVLWGRSMGAATSILVRHPLLAGIVVDSTFTSISEVCGAIAMSMGVPSMLVGPAIYYLKWSVSSRAGFNIYDVSPEQSAKNSGQIPMLMGHAQDDEFIPFEQGQRVFDAYAGTDKELVVLHGGHNGRRDSDWIGKGCRLCFRVFGIECDDFEPSLFTGFTEAETAPHFSSYQAMIQAKHATTTQ